MRYVFCDEHMTFEPKGEDCPGKAESKSRLTIMPDLPDFVSPVDGKVVHGRAGLREHNSRHNVTNVADFKDTWAKQREQREQVFQGRDSSRREDIARAVDKVFNGRSKK